MTRCSLLATTVAAVLCAGAEGAPAPSLEAARADLRRHVSAQVRDGRKRHALVSVAGRTMRVRVVGLMDDDGKEAQGLTVSVGGSSFTVSWEVITDAQLYGMGRKYMPEAPTGKLHLDLAVLAHALERGERMEEHLAAALRLDASLAGAAAALRGPPLAAAAGSSAGRAFKDGPAAAPRKAGGFAVPLTVYETLGIPRRNEPVTSGVPLPFGKVKDPRRLFVTDGAGREVPAQVRTLTRHEDGSLRWVLVDFPASCPANGQARYVLRQGTPRVAGTLKISKSGGAIVLDTGIVKLEIPTTGGALIGRAYVDSNRNGRYEASEAVIVGGSRNGILVDHGQPSGGVAGASAELEEQGPHKAVVKIHGICDTSSGLEYTARICVWGGSGIVKILLTVENPNAINPKGGDLNPAGNWLKGMGPHGGATNSIIFKDLSLVFHAPTDAARWSLLGDASQPVRSGSGAADIYQDSSGGEHWNHPNSAGTSFKGWKGSIGEGTRAIGAGDLSGPNGGLGIGVRWFWQNFPKAIALKAGEIKLGLWPEQWKGRTHEIRAGEHKTHEILLVLHRPGAGGERAVRIVQGLNEPLRAFASSRYYLNLGFVCPQGLPAGHPAMASYDAMVRAQFEGGRSFLKMTEGYDAYGWLDFGDAVADCELVREGGKRRVAYNSYGNMEYDLSMGLLFQCLRFLDTDPKFAMLCWRLHERGARHQVDIDLYHTKKGPFKIHWGGMYRHNEHDLDMHGNKHRGNMADYQHQWNQGLMHHYYFAGYRKCFEGAMGMADQSIARFGNGRQKQCWSGDYRRYGSQLSTTLEAFLATRDKKYEEHMTEIFKRTPMSTIRTASAGKRAPYQVAKFQGMAVVRLCDEYALAGKSPPKLLRDNLEAMCQGFLTSAAGCSRNSRGRVLDTLMAGSRYLGKSEYGRKASELYPKWPNRIYIHNKDMANKILGGSRTPFAASGGKTSSAELSSAAFRR